MSPSIISMRTWNKIISVLLLACLTSCYSPLTKQEEWDYLLLRQSLDEYQNQLEFAFRQFGSTNDDQGQPEKLSDMAKRLKDTMESHGKFISNLERVVDAGFLRDESFEFTGKLVYPEPRRLSMDTITSNWFRRFDLKSPVDFTEPGNRQVLVNYLIVKEKALEIVKSEIDLVYQRIHPNLIVYKDGQRTLFQELILVPQTITINYRITPVDSSGVFTLSDKGLVTIKWDSIPGFEPVEFSFQAI